MRIACFAIALIVGAVFLFPLDAPAKDAPKVGAGLPATWTGSWKGAATVERPGQKPLAFTMELHIAPLGERKASTWTIVYDGAMGKQTRPYEIIGMVDAPHHFRIDEKNGIIIDNYLYGDTLYSRFDVMQSNIATTHRLDGDTIEVEMVTTRRKPVSTTGGEDRIPAVNSYQVVAVQRCTLKRQPAKK